MKAIINDKLPKFLRINDYLPSQRYNKHLLNPYVAGELVKVASFDEQKRPTEIDEFLSEEAINRDPNVFKRQYVVIYRKSTDGNWKDKYTIPWVAVDLLTFKK